ncbi:MULTISPECIES: TonB-dependent receptor [Pseudomonas]|uniref:TonB-dependent siderophore receptor n=1 Tax=Pseudomonas tensinigenes TaxID=2745511 RepID=A0ABX8Q0L7_9PSED|nr:MULTISPECIES: TonB-dependent siderophore receptor [Pseudomonas]QXI07072.1 TonB-dependent siderophore receptor [Pseudomonas tensinigenes]WPN75548.1 TonB-dependent siderophore receptor [Pseudomonas germanica]
MARQHAQLPVSSPRLLASAIGVAITAGSAGQMVFAAEKTDSKAAGNAIALDATAITGEAQDSTSYQVEKASSPKYTAPLVDTPRSVTVIPQQVLKDTGALNMQDALRTVPGITFGAGEGGNPQGDRPFIRGFDAQGDTYLDGVRDTGSQSREIFAVENIEVSKGPNSAIGGRGAAGGSINLVSKKAHLGNSFDGGFTWGSDQTQRYTLDGNYQFSDTAAGRLNLMSHESNVAGRDKVDYDRWGIAPSLAFGLGTDTRVNLDYYHLESNDTPDSGVPYTIPAGGSAARTKSNPDKPYAGGDHSNFYGLDRDFRKGRTDTATFAIEHDLSDSLTIKNTLRHGTSMQDYILTQPDDSKGNVNNGSLWRRANTRVSNTETTTNQTDLFGNFYVAGFKNSFSTGVEYTREESQKSSYNVNTDTTPRTTNVAASSNCTPSMIGASSNYNCTSLSNPNPNDPWNGAISRNYAGTDTQANTYALYVFDTLELNEQWLVNMGLRYDHFDTDYKTYNAAGTTTSKGDDTSEFVTGQFGVVYKPAENGSIYASYATSATPPGNTLGEGQEGNPLGGTPDRSGNLLSSDMEPETTKNYEIGTKWDLLNDRLSLTADIFRTEKENARVQVDTTSYENAGKTRVQGVELSASGKITDKWQVFAGYAFMDSEQVDGGPLGKANDGNELPNTPKNSASLWTTYQVTPKLTIGGGAFYVDDVYGSVANTTMVDSYVRYDAMAAYKLTKNVDLQLNVQNLTNETYYDKAFSTHFANQAAGRTALLSTNFHF